MAVGPIKSRTGKAPIMRQGHTSGKYGLDPSGPSPVRDNDSEPPELTP